MCWRMRWLPSVRAARAVCAGDGDGDEALGAVGAVAGAEDEDDDWGLEEDDEKA